MRHVRHRIHPAWCGARGGGGDGDGAAEEGRDVDGGVVQTADGGTFGGGDAVARGVGGGDGGGGDTGSEGGAGVPGGGESGLVSSSAGGVEGGKISEDEICVGSRADGEGGAFGGGVAEHDRGERSKSRSSSNL